MLKTYIILKLAKEILQGRDSLHLRSVEMQEPREVLVKASVEAFGQVGRSDAVEFSFDLRRQNT